MSEAAAPVIPAAPSTLFYIHCTSISFFSFFPSSAIISEGYKIA